MRWVRSWVLAMSVVALTNPAQAEPVTDFALDTFPALLAAKPTGTQMIGPSDLYRLVTLLAAGSGGDTRSALAQALHAGPTVESAVALVGRARTQEGLSQAAGVWVAAGVTLNDRYRTVLAEQLGAQADSVDLANPATIARINAWVTQHSQGKITGLLPPGGSNAALIAATATHVKQRWAVPFASQATKPQAFILADGRTRDVPMMDQPSLTARYTETTDAQAVILPFDGGQFDLTIILPALGSAPASVALKPLLERGQYQDRSGHLSLPRLDVKSRIDLAEIHGAEWIRLLTDHPDLAGIAKGVSKVDNLFHSIALTLDETGAEAAAASAAIVSRSLRPTNFTMRVNRPFFVILRHVASDQPILLGLIADPVPEGQR